MKNSKNTHAFTLWHSEYLSRAPRARLFGCTWFLLLGLVSCTPGRLPAQPKPVYKLPAIADVPIVTTTSTKMVLAGRVLNVTLQYQSHGGRPLAHLYTSHPPHFVTRVARASSQIMDDFLRQRGLRIRDCRGTVYNLIIIVVDKSILGDQRRFPDFYPENVGGAGLYGQTLYGYYSSTPQIELNSTILVTDVSSYLNEEVLAHEMSHYWWDRLCIAAQVSETSEAFARAFDDYFMKRVGR